MMDLHALALLAALGLAPKQSLAHLDRVTGDFAVAVELGPRPFAGPAGDAAATLALVAIADHEAGFRPEVESCRVAGDQGRSVTLFQLMAGRAWDGHRRRELCTNGVLAAYLALRVLVTYGAHCTRKVPLGLFQGYASGSCGVPSQAATDMCRRWEQLATRAGLEGARCEKGGPIGWAASPALPTPTPAPGPQGIASR